MVMRRLGEIIWCIVFKEQLLEVVPGMDWQSVSGCKCTDKTNMKNRGGAFGGSKKGCKGL